MAEGENLFTQLTDAERKMIAKSREKKGRAARAAGIHRAEGGLPSLSNQWSNEVAFNLVESVRSRMVVYM